MANLSKLEQHLASRSYVHGCVLYLYISHLRRLVRSDAAGTRRRPRARLPTISMMILLWSVFPRSD
jgi:hypothetical protein